MLDEGHHAPETGGGRPGDRAAATVARSGGARDPGPAADARPRVTFVSRKWPPAMGGMETYAARLAEELQAHAEVGRLVLPGRADGSVPHPRELLRFGLATGARLLFARTPAPIVHIADMASWPLALCAVLRRPDTRVVLSAHGTDVAYAARGGLRGRLYGAHLRLGARLLPRAIVLANSAATARRTAEHGFRRIEVVPLAAEMEAPSRPTPRVSPRRAVLFPGRLIRRKGCGWFIRAVLPRLPGDITLDVAGTLWDPEEEAALADPRVRYLGKLDRPALARACADALCVVVPNIETEDGEFEGFGLVGVEAAAAGGVVLAANHGGIPDAVLDGRTGFLLPPGDAGAWADRIRAVAGWPEARRTAFVAAAQEICGTQFTWARVARETAAHYRAGAAR
jgi:glycosyltransferase involved in cell wall biosynthesis